MHETVVDGVPTYVAPGREGVTEAELSFAVGLAHESLHESGLAHLVEHLCLGAVRDTPVSFNGSVDLESTTFTVSGSTARVGAFLTRLCEALAELPMERFETEKKVIATEGGGGVSPVVARLLARRFGTGHGGVVHWSGRPLEQATPALARGFAARWFTAANAYLAVEGELPVGLRLPLPAGRAPARSPAPVYSSSGPVVVTDDDLCGAGAGALVHLPWSEEQHTAMHVPTLVRQRIEDRCRHRDGHSYSVDLELLGDADGLTFVVTADAREDAHAAVATEVVAAVLDMVATGPEPEELARSQEQFAESKHDPRSVLGEAASAAAYRLLGFPEREPWSVAASDAVTPVDVHQALQRARGSVVFFVEPGSVDAVVGDSLPLEQVCGPPAEVPQDCARFRPRLRDRARYRAARQDVLLHHPTGLGCLHHGERHFVPWEDVAGVARCTEDLLVVLGRRGCTIAVGAAFSRSAPVHDEVLRRVAPELVYWVGEEPAPATATSAPAGG